MSLAFTLSERLLRETREPPPPAAAVATGLPPDSAARAAAYAATAARAAADASAAANAAATAAADAAAAARAVTAPPPAPNRIANPVTAAKAAADAAAEADEAAAAASAAAVDAAAAAALKTAIDAQPERRLRVFSIDPTSGARPGGVVTLGVPVEMLAPVAAAPRMLGGKRFVIVAPARDCQSGQQGRFDGFTLDDTTRLIDAGYVPSLADPKFTAQMVYAVAMSLDAAFRDALGRVPLFGLGRQRGDLSSAKLSPEERLLRGGVDTLLDGRLVLDPWAQMGEAQAWFDGPCGAIRFGFYKARNDARGYSPESLVYTALSHDVIVHELSHALLDAVHPHLMVPVGADVFAFHEAFADLMVVFQRLSYPELVKGQMALARGRPGSLDLLNTLATGFASTAFGRRTLRTIDGEDRLDGAGNEPHERGAVLVQAVYRAFRTLLERRIARVVAIATSGRGILREGELPPVMIDEIARLTGKTARMFQSVLIRALDYCPPLGIGFFDFLCAIVAADSRLVPIDDEGVREALIEAFRFHRIFPDDALHLAEEALIAKVGNLASKNLTIPALSFFAPRFASEPGQPMAVGPAVEQAAALAAEIGASLPWTAFLAETFAEDSSIEIVSIRSFARPGPQRMTEFGTVVQLVQRTDSEGDASGYLAASAATLLFDSNGCLLACAARNGSDEKRRKEARRYSDSAAGQISWSRDADGKRTLAPGYPAKLCS